MFERFKAYKKLLKESNEALYLNAKLRKEMWYKRKMAVSYNLNLIKYGL